LPERRRHAEVYNGQQGKPARVARRKPTRAVPARARPGLLRQASLKGLRRDRSVESLRAAARDVVVITCDAG